MPGELPTATDQQHGEVLIDRAKQQRDLFMMLAAVAIVIFVPGYIFFTGNQALRLGVRLTVPTVIALAVVLPLIAWICGKFYRMIIYDPHTGEAKLIRRAPLVRDRALVSDSDASLVVGPLELSLPRADERRLAGWLGNATLGRMPPYFGHGACIEIGGVRKLLIGADTRQEVDEWLARAPAWLSRLHREDRPFQGEGERRDSPLRWFNRRRNR